MIDVVSRLRTAGPGDDVTDLMKEAAAEIERLRIALNGVKIIARTRALKEFDGQPWLERIRETEI